jgi:hypothetical protein
MNGLYRDGGVWYDGLAGNTAPITERRIAMILAILKGIIGIAELAVIRDGIKKLPKRAPRARRPRGCLSFTIEKH